MFRVKSILRELEQSASVISSQARLIAEQALRLNDQTALIAEQIRQRGELEKNSILLSHIEQRIFSNEIPMQLSTNFKRNILPNDNAALQKLLMAFWNSISNSVLNYKDLLGSGFRVYSQNDEDGILLRIFSKVGTVNSYVLEIGSNCSGSDIGIPENLSANLIVNHGWHGAIVELDETECKKMRHFFAQNLATKHFHMTGSEQSSYFSPDILQREVTPENINALFKEANAPDEPDLLVLDIDGGDYAVMEQLTAVRPRVMVVEFEKRFRDRFCVVQPDRRNFSLRFPQSGTVSLAAWQKLLNERGYTLCAIGTCGFNAFFVRDDVADGKIAPLSVSDAFDQHPLFMRAPEALWLEPDETWDML